MNRRGFLGLGAALFFGSASAGARPGGGQSFGGSGRSSGGSGPSSGGSQSGSGSWSSGGSSNKSSSGGGWNWPSSPTRSDGSTGSTPSPSYDRGAAERQREFDHIQDQTTCLSQCVATSADFDRCRSSCERRLERQHDEERRKQQEQQEQSADSDLASSTRGAALFPVMLGLGLAGLVSCLVWARRREDAAWASALVDDNPDHPLEGVRSYASVAGAIAALRGKDEAFSWVLFEDFAHALFVEAHTLRGSGDLGRLTPYLSEASSRTLASTRVDAVTTVIVGSQRVTAITASERTRRVVASVLFEVNYTEVKGGVETSYYAVERWAFSRGVDVTSRPPKRAAVIDCPNCGAPLEKLVAGRCKYCNVAPGGGAHDWMVDSIQVESKSVRAPMLTADTEEVGTDWPTKVAPDVKAAYAALTARDVEFSWPAFTERVGTVFTAFHDAWSSQALDEMRPLLTDNLLETQRYWLCAYRAAGLRNISADARIASIEIARVTADKYFDAITVRVYATNLDYTVDNNDKVVSGSRSRARQYSEYWTFVRGLRRSSTGAECPNCGAPATEAGMTGRCGACGVKVQHSSFDWVLSRIEQDEAYQP